MKAFERLLMLALAAAALIAGCGKSGEPDDPGQEPEQPSEKTYSIGDFYSEGFVKGIVVSTDEKGEHGLIVSLKEYDAAWAYREENVMDGRPQSGMNNTECVRRLKNWREYYPAFERATSENIGALKEWFLPSMAELALLYEAYSGHPANDVEQGTGSTRAQMTESESKAWFNKRLTDNKGSSISDFVYWSSNEIGPSIASAFDMLTGTSLSVPSDLDKKLVYKVRAMASF